MNLDAETYIHNMAEGDLLRRMNTRNVLADFLQGNVHRELRRMSRFQVRKSSQYTVYLVSYRARVTQVAHRLQRWLPSCCMKASLVFIFVKLPDLLAQLFKDYLLMADKLNVVHGEEGHQFA